MSVPNVNETTVGATQIVDRDGDIMSFDNSTWALNGIDYAHHEVHSGSAFLFNVGFQLNNSSREYMLVTPDTTKWAHLVIDVMGAQDTSMAIIEDTQKTGGTTTTVFNHNRNSVTESTTKLFLSPTGAHGTGVTITTFQWGVPTQGSGRGSGSESRGEHEIILKQNSKYAIIVTALSANPNNISMHLSWYEHTNK